MEQNLGNTGLGYITCTCLGGAMLFETSKSLRKDTKIRIFNACVKSVLLYGCETWLVTKEIQRKIQTFGE